jgi:hypothetical protein
MTYLSVAGTVREQFLIEGGILPSAISSSMFMERKFEKQLSIFHTFC